MTRSLKGKLLALLVAIFAATAACVILISMQDVRSFSKRAEARSADNVLELVRHTVETTYRNLLSERVEAVTSRKQRLAEAAAVAVDGLREFAALAERGALSPQEARQQALRWIRGLPLGEKAYFLVYDATLQPLVRNFGPGIGSLAGAEDIKGRPLLASMRGEADTYGSAYGVFETQPPQSGQPARLLGYFAKVPGSDWVLSTGVDIADVEREEARRRENALDILGRSLREIRIATSGFAFVFDGGGRLLIAPPPRPSPMDNAVSDVVSTGSLATIIAAVKNESTPLTLKVRDDQNLEHAVDVRVFHYSPLDWYVAVASFQDEVAAPAQSLAWRQALVIGAVFLVAFILTAILVDRIAKPLRRLAGLAVQIGSEDFASPDRPIGDALQKLSRSRTDEVSLVALALRTMETSLRENIANLLQATKERERIDYELNLARTIQMDMLPGAPEAHLSEDGAELHALLIPAREVGGDLFYYERLGPGRIFFAVGDVAGKGVPASLFMALTMSILKSKTRQVADPGRMLLEINDELCRGNASNMFVTLFVGILNTEDGDLRYASGGHNPPLVVKSDGSTEFLTVTEDPMLGILPEASFSTHVHTIAPGETLVAYSDGVTEAMNPARALFGERRLELVAGKYFEKSPKVLSKIIVKAVEIHGREAEQSDDVTLLVLRRLDNANEHAAPVEEEPAQVRTMPLADRTQHDASRAYTSAEVATALKTEEPELQTPGPDEATGFGPDAAGETARDAELDALLSHGGRTASLVASAHTDTVEEADVERIIPEQPPELDLDVDALTKGLDDDAFGISVAAQHTDEIAEALNGDFARDDEDDEPLDLAPEWTIETQEADDITSALYLGDELEDLETDEDLPLDLPESVFSADAAFAEQSLEDLIPEPPNLDDFRLTADPEDLLETDDAMELLSFDLDEGDSLDDVLPPPSPAAPDGYSDEPLPEGGFEVIPSPPGEMYAQNPDLQNRSFEPYDDPGSFISIHSDVAMYPQHPDSDVEFALDDADESGYFELEIGGEGNRYEDLYLDESTIGGIDAEDDRRS